MFVQHSAASLLIQKNAHPAVRHDLENWISRLVSEGDPHYSYTTEETDDMPAHIRATLTAISIGIMELHIPSSHILAHNPVPC